MISSLLAIAIAIVATILLPPLNINITTEGASFIHVDVSKSFRHSIVQSTVSPSSSSLLFTSPTTTTTIERNSQQQQNIKMDRDSKNTSNSNSTSTQSSRQLPIYITIGPQGIGKTTFLSKLKERYENHNSTDIDINTNTASTGTTTATLQDITIDDQDGVYIPTPIQLWLINQPPSIRSNNTNIQSIDSYLQTNLHGKTISNRIYNDTNTIEMRLVIQRLNNILTADQFRQHILSLNGSTSSNNSNTDHSTNASLRQLCKKQRHETIVLPYDWKERLIYIVEEFHANELKLLEGQRSNVVQLFIVESIFRNQTPMLKTFLSTFNSEKNNSNSSSSNSSSNSNNNGNSNSNGINAASSKLNHFAQHEPQTALAWGNTNTKATDYVSALEVAEKSQRPVIFVPYLDKRQKRSMNMNMNVNMNNNNNNNTTIHDIYNDDNHESFFLPQVEINELIKRNIARCYTTGKYVPVKAIIDTCLRVDELMNKALDEVKMQSSSSQHKKSRKSTISTKQQLDSVLAKMAGFRMDNMNRTVYKAGGMQSNQRKSNSNQRKNYKSNRRYNF